MLIIKYHVTKEILDLAAKIRFFRSNQIRRINAGCRK